MENTFDPKIRNTNNEVERKTCIYCRRHLPLNRFYKRYMSSRKSNKAQRRAYCKTCQERQKKQTLANKPERLQKLKEKNKRSDEKRAVKKEYGIDSGTPLSLDFE